MSFIEVDLDQRVRTVSREQFRAKLNAVKLTIEQREFYATHLSFLCDQKSVSLMKVYYSVYLTWRLFGEKFNFARLSIQEAMMSFIALSLIDQDKNDVLTVLQFTLLIFEEVACGPILGRFRNNQTEDELWEALTLEKTSPTELFLQSHIQS